MEEGGGREKGQEMEHAHEKERFPPQKRMRPRRVLFIVRLSSSSSASHFLSTQLLRVGVILDGSAAGVRVAKEEEEVKAAEALPCQDLVKGSRPRKRASGDPSFPILSTLLISSLDVSSSLARRRDTKNGPSSLEACLSPATASKESFTPRLSFRVGVVVVDACPPAG